MKILVLEQWTNSGLLIQRSHITSASHSKIFLCIFTNHKDWGKYWFDIKKPVLRHKYELQLWSVKNILGITNRNYTSRKLFDNLKLIKVFINSSVNYNNCKPVAENVRLVTATTAVPAIHLPMAINCLHFMTWT